MRTSPDHRQNSTAGASTATPSASRHLAAHRVLAAVTGAALVAGLSACVGGVTGAQPGAAEPATAASPSAASPDPAPSTGPGSSEAPAEPLAETSGGQLTDSQAAATETVKKTVTDALGRLAAGSPKPATAQVTEALTGAGVNPAALQVSQSRTPTGLEADAIEASVLQGSDCVIGQVRDGAVTVTVLPVLASGKCFVGS
ncbi:hypothetical protein M8J71_16710 [Pseudarthrobacter sp. R1]|uniref:DUF6993 domain-containing protein n=1 Tax=Pseudarthrobacter sp. R1 TaxID=2944934 RepID=UPI002109CED9|nr:hypothetical protein [Pseudarthrobacter sp. R1]MCQ6272109.1 hypothetical protein [Pseudarthrobacter sp. R1]